MNTVLLDKAKHDRNRFNCGIEALNNYLKVMASQQAKKDNTRTFVLEDDSDNSHVIGFYTLTMTPIDLKHCLISYKKAPIIHLWWSDCPSCCR
ncbi:acetyltransferase [Vibrio astriarenae]|nr:acetyltransferase [Vibrio sp. C7]